MGFGSYVKQNSRTIPAVEILQGGSFSFPPKQTVQAWVAKKLVYVILYEFL